MSATPIVLRLIGLFLISRALLFIPHVNMRFDTNIMHLPDMTLNPTFWEMWLMPGQPMGFSVMTSLLLDTNHPIFFSCVLFTGLGMALLLTLFRMLIVFGVDDKRAAVYAFIFMMLPATLLFERQYFYAYPIIVSLAVGAALFVRASRSPSFVNWLFSHLMFAIPCWFHAFFHPVYMLAPAIAAMVHPARKVALVALLPAVIVAAAPAIKNGILYETWTGSSWGPFSLANVIYYPHDQLTPLLQFVPFTTNIDDYPVTVEPPTRHPILDAPFKADGGQNWMRLQTVPLGRAMQAESLRYISKHPLAYWQGVQGALYFYLQSPADWFWVRNRERLGIYQKAFNLMTTGTLITEDVPIYTAFRREFDASTKPMPTSLIAWGQTHGWDHFPLLSVVVLPVLFLWGLYNAVVAARRRNALGPSWVLLLMLTSYVTLLSLTLELGENQRFRGYIGFVLCIYFWTLMEATWQRFKRTPRTGRQQ